jgi:hypothetical protein
MCISGHFDSLFTLVRVTGDIDGLGHACMMHDGSLHLPNRVFFSDGIRSAAGNIHEALQNTLSVVLLLRQVESNR